MKLFSVCIITYGKMEAVEVAIKSVLMQNYKKIELIVADDAHPDFDRIKVEKIIKKHNKNNFKYKIIQNTKNLGTVKNINSAISECTGDYVLFFAGDDRLHDETVISNFVKTFKTTDCNIVSSQCLLQDENLKTTEGLFLNTSYASKLNHLSTRKLYLQMCRECFFASGATAYRREIFSKYGYFDESYKYVEDWPFYLKILRSSERIRYEDFISLDHRNGGISHSNEITQHTIDYYRDMKNVYKKEVLKHLNILHPIDTMMVLLYIARKFLKTLVKNKTKNVSDHTFVICAYKDSPYLEECVKSLLSQKLKSNVIISTSTPGESIAIIAKKYNLELRINTKKSNHVKDFNFAYAQARTKYVTLCHQDDIYLPDFSLKTIQKIEKNKNSLIAFTDYSEKRGEKIKDKNAVLIIKRIINFPLLFFKRSKKVRLFSLSIGNAICAPTVTYNKELIDRPLINTDFKSNIDWVSWINFAKMDGKFVYIKRKLLYRRIHEGSTTTAVISDNTKAKEDYKIFRMFWSERFSKILLKIYGKSEDYNATK